jgi:hypothetical protein
MAARSWRSSLCQSLHRQLKEEIIQMALSKSVSVPDVPVTTENRTFRAILETPVAGNYSVNVYREDADRDVNLVAIEPTRRSSMPVYRTAASVAAETVMVGGQSISAATIITALPLFFDRWTQEDIAAGKRSA